MQTYQGATASGTFPTTVSSIITPLSSGSAVSMSAQGSVQLGAGTTIYRNVGPVPIDPCPKYISSTPVFDDKYLISFVDGITGQGSISVMSLNSSKKAVVLATNYSSYNLYHVVTLNQATGLFVSIGQDETFNGTHAAVIAGRSVKSDAYAITFGAPLKYTFYLNYSVDPSIAALSNTTFAIAYYGNSNSQSYVYTRFGKISSEWSYYKHSLCPN
jgi:hypothetical protein